MSQIQSDINLMKTKHWGIFKNLMGRSVPDNWLCLKDN